MLRGAPALDLQAIQCAADPPKPGTQCSEQKRGLILVPVQDQQKCRAVTGRQESAIHDERVRQRDQPQRQGGGVPSHRQKALPSDSIEQALPGAGCTHAVLPSVVSLLAPHFLRSSFYGCRKLSPSREIRRPRATESGMQSIVGSFIVRRQETPQSPSMVGVPRPRLHRPPGSGRHSLPSTRRPDTTIAWGAF